MIVGRYSEQQTLQKIFEEKTSAFVVVYGRRRVGKTFLIREYFQNNFTFSLTGMANVNTAQQLNNFYAALKNTSGIKEEIKPAQNWLEAFGQLKELIQKSTNKKKIIFLDELPWLDTSKSFFVSALEHFWNSFASARKDVLLIACGSAASWMINKLINNTGGLHNRVTHKIKVNPFTISETKEFFKQKKSKWENYQLIEIYMAVGGIPYYLNAFDTSKSIAQNINSIFFDNSGLLGEEFKNLYRSLFKNANNHELIIKALSSKVKGLSRKEILSATKLSDGGSITKCLQELEECGFIRTYSPFGRSKKDGLFQLIDFYSLFYHQFIVQNKGNENYWLNLQDSGKHRAWSGYAFELICLTHLPQIKKALGILGVQTEAYSWRSSITASGAQIDLVIDRRDQIINICEMKFSLNEFTIDKAYEKELKNKITAFKAETKTKKAVFMTFVTTYGLKNNNASQELVSADLKMDIFFD